MFAHALVRATRQQQRRQAIRDLPASLLGDKHVVDRSQEVAPNAVSDPPTAVAPSFQILRWGSFQGHLIILLPATLLSRLVLSQPHRHADGLFDEIFRAEQAHVDIWFIFNSTYSLRQCVQSACFFSLLPLLALSSPPFLTPSYLPSPLFLESQNNLSLV